MDRNETLQPVVCVVGKDLDSIDENYVIVDEQQYKTSTCLEAIDLTFKIFWSLDCSYPKPSLRIWQCLQQAAYDIDLLETNIKSVKELLGLTKKAIEESNLIESVPDKQ